MKQPRIQVEDTHVCLEIGNRSNRCNVVQAHSDIMHRIFREGQKSRVGKVTSNIFFILNIYVHVMWFTSRQPNSEVFVITYAMQPES